jgi:hypothetical protein
MRQGSYHRRVDFDAFRVRKFVAHVFSPHYGIKGCGATALALLTGVNPIDIPYPPGNGDDWTKHYVYSFLRKKQFDIAELTMRNVTNFSHPRSPVSGQHVILASIKFIKGEASWVVVHNRTLYHNFEIATFTPYELINHPIMTAALIKHRTWM